MTFLHLIHYSSCQPIINPSFFFFISSLHQNNNNNNNGRHTSSTNYKLSKQKLLFRRSANYQPPKWDFDLSLKNEYEGKMYIQRASVLKEQVKMMLDDDDEKILLVSQLALIDNLQRLGISYHFEDKIESILRRIYYYSESSCGIAERKGLYETALQFRLLRQHHFHVPQEVFDHFKCEKGNFKACLGEDTRGLLYLYEASFLSTENEETLDLAREFTTHYLRKNLEEKRLDAELTVLVQHALELPLHWRMPRLEARWFIDEVYEKRPGMNPKLLEFAKLDFNVVQAIHQKDLKYASCWWKSTSFGEKFKFARDRLVENFFWTVGVTFNPEYGYCRRMSTKINALITTIDDIYDVYGTLDELELFTDAVQRWDVKAVDQLPDYMKMCFLGLFNTINEMAYDVLKEQGYNIIPHLSKAVINIINDYFEMIIYNNIQEVLFQWADICQTYLKEAKWYSSGYTPTLQEYLNNAWISISAPVILVHAYFFVTNPIKKEDLDYLNTYHKIIRCSAMVLRLANDLGTSSDELERGDVPKSIQCYMKETGDSEEEARRHIKSLITETWKEMNKEGGVKECRNFSRRFVEIAMNLGRMAQCMYQNGDGHGHQDSITTQRILALLFQPVPLHR